MKIITNPETIAEISKVVNVQTDKPKYVRIFVAGYGWGGPTLGLALDELKDDDVTEEEGGISFIMEKYLSESLGDVEVLFMGTGYYVAPADQPESSC